MRQPTFGLPGTGKMDNLILPAKMDSLEPFRAHVLERVANWQLPPAVCAKIELVLEEVLTNIIHYAYPDAEGKVEVRCAVDPNRVFHLEILDWGSPFDPLSSGRPDVSQDAENRNVGGLGIFLLRNMVDELHYKREAGKNILSIAMALN